MKRNTSTCKKLIKERKNKILTDSVLIFLAYTILESK
jgi:hypothetical protein